MMRNAFASLRSIAAMTATAMFAVAGLGAPALALDDDTFDDVAIIIGNKNYSSDVAPVEFAHNDADAMQKFVVDVLGFDPENVIVLKDATKNQLETHFSKGGILGDWIEPNGNSDVVVFYSGHGVPGLQDSNSYLLPVDGNPNKAEISGYPLAEFYANLKSLKAKSITVYLDACFSGDSGGGVLFRDASPVFQAARKDRGAGRTHGADREPGRSDRLLGPRCAARPVHQLPAERALRRGRRLALRQWRWPDHHVRGQRLPEPQHV